MRESHAKCVSLGRSEITLSAFLHNMKHIPHALHSKTHLKMAWDVTVPLNSEHITLHYFFFTFSALLVVTQSGSRNYIKTKKKKRCTKKSELEQNIPYTTFANKCEAVHFELFMKCLKPIQGRWAHSKIKFYRWLLDYHRQPEQLISAWNKL